MTQAECQLLLPRLSDANPKISAYAYLYEPHNYNAKPFTPIGMEMLIHEQPSKRKTFTQHCAKSWVLGTPMEHYRCWNMWVIKTRSKRVSDMVFFKHKYITNSSVTPTNAVIAVAGKMAETMCTHMHPRMDETTIQTL